MRREGSKSNVHKLLQVVQETRPPVFRCAIGLHSMGKRTGQHFSYGRVLIILSVGNGLHSSLGHLGSVRSIKLLSY